MDDRDAAHFGYRLRQADGEWRWTAFNPAGQVTAKGRAPSRAAAAACVIRALARQAVEAKDGEAKDGEAQHGKAQAGAREVGRAA